MESVRQPLATEQDFCAYAGLTRGQSAQLRYLGNGPRFIRVTGKQIRYRWEDVEAWVAENTFVRSDQRPPVGAGGDVNDQAHSTSTPAIAT